MGEVILLDYSNTLEPFGWWCGCVGLPHRGLLDASSAYGGVTKMIFNISPYAHMQKELWTLKVSQIMEYCITGDSLLDTYSHNMLRVNRDFPASGSVSF